MIVHYFQIPTNPPSESKIKATRASHHKDMRFINERGKGKGGQQPWPNFAFLCAATNRFDPEGIRQFRMMESQNQSAEAQRARLGMIGLEAKISEREQGGRVVHRVRVGPLNTKVEAERVRDRLEDARIDSAMVRVQR